ncbi:MAG: transposase [Planctomycetota bacterium]
MEPDRPHQKRVRHYDDPGHLRELTFSCYRRMPLLTNDVWRAELSRSVDRAMLGHGYRLAAFVYMPEHVHLVVYPRAEADGIDRLLRAIKRPYSYRIKKLLAEAGSPLLEKLTIRQRPGVQTFRFWQEGPGYDRNLTEAKTVLSSIDYVHMNPVRRGLCRAAVDWRWSTARHHAAEEPPQDPLLPVVHGLPAEFFDPRDD